MTSKQIQMPRLTNEETQIIQEKKFFFYYSHWQKLKMIVDIQGWQGCMEMNTACGMELYYCSFS